MIAAVSAASSSRPRGLWGVSGAGLSDWPAPAPARRSEIPTYWLARRMIAAVSAASSSRPRGLWGVSQRLAGTSTGPSLGDSQFGWAMINPLPATGGAWQIPASASFKISLSQDQLVQHLEIAFQRPPFSFSRSLRRLAWSVRGRPIPGASDSNSAPIRRACDQLDQWTGPGTGPGWPGDWPGAKATSASRRC